MFLADIGRFQSLDIAFIYFLFHRNRIFSYISSKIFNSKCQVLGGLSQSLIEQVDKKISKDIEKLDQLTLPN